MEIDSKYPWDHLSDDAQHYWSEIAYTLTRVIHEEDKKIRVGLIRSALKSLDNYLFAMTMRCKQCYDGRNENGQRA